MGVFFFWCAVIARIISVVFARGFNHPEVEKTWNSGQSFFLKRNKTQSSFVVGNHSLSPNRQSFSESWQAKGARAS